MTNGTLKPATHNLSWLCFTLLLVLSTGCHTTKKVVKTPVKTPVENPSVTTVPLSADSLLTRLKENSINYKTFSAKAKLNFTTPKESQKGITTYIRMQKDSAIWISVRPVLGIELIRVLITPDSVKMINFFKKTLTVAGADSLQQLLHIPYSFSALQDLIIGNPVLLTSPENIQPHGDTIVFSCTKENMTSHYQLASNTFLLLANQLILGSDTGAARSSNQLFQNYGDLDGQHFSLNRVIDVHSSKPAHIEISFSKVELNEPVGLPFPEPSGYDRN